MIMSYFKECAVNGINPTAREIIDFMDLEFDFPKEYKEGILMYPTLLYAIESLKQGNSELLSRIESLEERLNEN